MNNYNDFHFLHYLITCDEQTRTYLVRKLLQDDRPIRCEMILNKDYKQETYDLKVYYTDDLYISYTAYIQQHKDILLHFNIIGDKPVQKDIELYDNFNLFILDKNVIIDDIDEYMSFEQAFSCSYGLFEDGSHPLESYHIHNLYVQLDYLLPNDNDLSYFNQLMYLIRYNEKNPLINNIQYINHLLNLYKEYLASCVGNNSQDKIN